jgi:hypothetical protein
VPTQSSQKLYFEDIVSDLRPFHEQLEEEFLTLNKTIPYEHNSPRVYSPLLYTMLQSACSHVIAMMQRLEEELSYPGAVMTSKGRGQKKFPTYYLRLNKNNVLSKQVLYPRQKVLKTVKPFFVGKNPGNFPAPAWWTRYNNSKHSLPDGAYVGTIENVMNAVGALYILHNLAGAIIKGLSPTNALDGSKWRIFGTKFRKDFYRLKGSTTTTAILQSADTGGLAKYKSRIFYFPSEFHNT